MENDKKLLRIKDQVAREIGYPDWESMYNWVSRDGQNPCVVAQLIESAMDCCISKLLKILK